MSLRIARPLWNQLTSELHRRTENRHESGAFLLGRRTEGERRALKPIYYDELDRAAYDSGVCILHADAFSRLWDRCSELEMTVVADAHVHPLGAGQSSSDRENPMIARPGHIAIILPRMANPPIRRWSVGVYEYLGDHRWQPRGGCGGSTLKIGE
jgi:hypothetical protein